MSDDVPNDWDSCDPTHVSEFDPNVTPMHSVKELPGYEIGYNTGYAQGRLDGQEDAKVKDWLEGVNQTLIFMRKWLEERDIPNADHIVESLKQKLFNKP
jgi:hypothetical protein